MAKFDGMHFGMGFGPMTEFLQGVWSPQILETQGHGMFAQYIAINDKDGVFTGTDWTAAILFKWDEDTHEIIFDETGSAIAQEVSPTGAEPPPLPNGYVFPKAYWYQDLPLMDLDNLKDGAPSD
jgi:hypothetical protein